MFRPPGRCHSACPGPVQLTRPLTDRPAARTLQQDPRDRPAIDRSQPERSVEEAGNSGSQPDRSVEEGGSSSDMGARWEMFGQQRGILHLLEILLCVVLIAMVGHGGGGGGPPRGSLLQPLLVMVPLILGLLPPEHPGDHQHGALLPGAPSQGSPGLG